MKQAIILATWSHKKHHEHWAAGYQNVCDPDRAVPRHWAARPLHLHLKSPLLRPPLLLFCPSRFQNAPLTILNWYFQHTHAPSAPFLGSLHDITAIPQSWGKYKSKNCGRAYQQTTWIHKETLQKERITSDYTDKHDIEPEVKIKAKEQKITP